MVDGFRAVPPRVICHDYRYRGDYRCDRNLDLSFFRSFQKRKKYVGVIAGGYSRINDDMPHREKE